MAKSSPLFVFDTSGLTVPYRYWYPPDNAPNFWDNLAKNVENGTIVAPIHVLYELEKRDDGLHKLAKTRLKKMFVEPQENVQSVVQKICNGLDPHHNWNTQEIADPWCIALAEANEITLVHHETQPKKTQAQNIYNICVHRKVSHMRTYELVQQLKWKL